MSFTPGFSLAFFFFLRWLVQTSTSFATGHFVSDFAIVHNLKPTSYLTLLFKGHPSPILRCKEMVRAAALSGVPGLKTLSVSPLISCQPRASVAVTLH